ncbi:trypco2 family protein [Streptomyces sp. HB2AG]|uniref:trypco2 family protein n=1 Tax=Streptomyces sp. HB2AG TaxID=2983400 RepID=UPI0022AB29C6|nr:trypco2 family protein [Streptomyces sp. HB2AG]MCZ2526796.1 hypothetical protein [Streptomyces sp. HB2AG]
MAQETPGNGPGNGFELVDAVVSIRDDLMAAAERGAGEDLRFDVGDIELELSVEMRRDARARTGVKAWVVSGEAEAGAGRTRTHRVTVTLRPRDRRTGGGWEIAHDDEGHTWAR